ncbi:putative cytokinetic ring protein SteA [Saccharomonospora iraqiensis]|uniref:putative cytokinetic ring protein SteA n=1 Tax=Saccharomonospora iraqiensis TaxID=52698 RepID=UPI00022DF0D4|nr:putative cytokinetic ring protein SteA [Saccharomonospora iraqiensis]
MRLTGLLARSTGARPGITGTARVDRRPRDLRSRIRPGDIAVLDHTDLDRADADALVRAGVAAVVNAAPSISGRYPNLGPEALLEAGVPLVDDVGSAALRRIRDGSRIRVHDGTVYAGDRELATGTVQTAESVAERMDEARAGMSAQLEAFSANTMEFLRRERALVLDGVGVPAVAVRMAGRHVLVVAPGPGHAEELHALRGYLDEHRPVLIGVESAADTLRAAGRVPDIVVGDPSGVDTATLRASTEVVVPADPDGHAPGLQRAQDLGIGAVAFPASGNPEDLALLLADAHDAALVVGVGFQATLGEFLDHGRSGSNPSTFLTRLRLGTRLIDGAAVATLHRGRVSLGAVVFLVLSAVVVVAVAVLASGAVGWIPVDRAAHTMDLVTDWLSGVAGGFTGAVGAPAGPVVAGEVLA